jgi:hypothetical protein
VEKSSAILVFIRSWNDRVIKRLGWAEACRTRGRCHKWLYNFCDTFAYLHSVLRLDFRPLPLILASLYKQVDKTFGSFVI